MATAEETKAADEAKAAEAEAAKKAADEAKAQNDRLGLDEVQANIEDGQRKGYSGLKADPLPNSAHSQESGPDAPPVHEQTAPNIDDLTKEG